MFMEQATSTKEFRLERFEHATRPSKKTRSGLLYEERLETEFELSYPERPDLRTAQAYRYNPRNSEAIYAIPALEPDQNPQCFANLRSHKTNNNNYKKMFKNKLVICQIIVLISCLIVSSINVYFLVQFKLQNPKIEARVKELEENGHALKDYVRAMKNNTKDLMDMVQPLQAYVCYNLNLSRAERIVLGCVSRGSYYK